MPHYFDMIEWLFKFKCHTDRFALSLDMVCVCMYISLLDWYNGVQL